MHSVAKPTFQYKQDGVEQVVAIATVVATGENILHVKCATAICCHLVISSMQNSSR